MIDRIVLGVVIAFLLGAPATAVAQNERGPHDMAYTSPNWGYQVRWYSDEWTVDRESSEDELDSLWLSDAAGNVAGFDGAPGFAGDAAGCLDQLIADVEATPDATDIEIVSDEEGTAQIARDSWWSWAILLARVPGDSQPVDYAIYLDCRTLVPGSAVLARRIAGPAATFEESLDRFAIVDAALPRSAWLVNQEYGGVQIGNSQMLMWPILFDQVCGGYPRWGNIAYDEAGNERAMLSVVDGTPEFSREGTGANAIRVVVIENTGDTPLTVEPTDFFFVDTAIDKEARQDVAPAVAVWDDTGDAAVRELGPGDLATAWVAWPDGILFPDQGVNFIFRNPALSEDVELGSIDVAGGCGAGSRPKLRLGR